MMLLRILDRLEEIIIALADGGRDDPDLHFRRAPLRHRHVRFCIPILIQIHISWAQELCIYMFIWMAKFGAAYGVRTGIHVGVDVLINRLNDRWRRASSCSACSAARCSPRSSAPWARNSSSN